MMSVLGHDVNLPSKAQIAADVASLGGRMFGAFSPTLGSSIRNISTNNYQTQNHKFGDNVVNMPVEIHSVTKESLPELEKILTAAEKRVMSSMNQKASNKGSLLGRH